MLRWGSRGCRLVCSGMNTKGVTCLFNNVEHYCILTVEPGWADQAAGLLLVSCCQAPAGGVLAAALAGI